MKDCCIENKCREDKCHNHGFSGIGAILVLYIILIIILGCTFGTGLGVV